MFKNLLGASARLQELRDDPLLVKGISVEELDEYIEELRNRDCYAGIREDLANRRKDKENFARDFSKAFQAAKARLGV